MRPYSIASLPMYTDPAPLRRANDRLMDGVFRELGLGREAAPAALYRQWLHPRLLFSQTCGYPLITRLDGRVTPFARPMYRLGAHGVEAGRSLPAPGWHRSLIVTRTDDARDTLLEFRGARAAINSRDSNSGMNLFRHRLAAMGARDRFFSAVRVSGSHRASLEAVATAYADIAAIDEVTWAGFLRFAPATRCGLRVLDVTAASPTLPLITAAQTSPTRCNEILDALNRVLAAEPDIGSTLGLTAFEAVNRDSYKSLRAYEIEAERMGYWRLA